jgi:hypothetical protein
MAARFDFVLVRWQVEGMPACDVVLTLDRADQDDPRIDQIRALIAWALEKDSAAVAAAPGGDALIGSG